MKKCLYLLTILAMLIQPALYFLPEASAQEGGDGLQSPQDEPITIFESFMGATAPGWEQRGNASLTNGGGNGWLRLTSNAQYQAGAAFYNTAYPSNAVFDIEFDYATWGGNGADGLTFFLINGFYTPTTPGGAGGWLGYGGVSPIAGAYFAVGFDEQGDDSVGIYEPGNYSAGPSYWVFADIPATREAPKHVNIIFYNNLVSVWLAGVQVIADYSWTAQLPATVKFGFSAGTGSEHNYHEIRNATIRMIRPEGSPEGILRVTPSGLPNWPCGESWETACSMQSALNYAVDGNEIWVAEGSYYPGPIGGNRLATFQLKNNVAVYGGFAGTETSREQRDPAANVTTLSGDIGVAGNNSDNSYHVVTGSGVDATAILDGFTITAGNANANSPWDSGGGMYNDNGSPTVTNVSFSGNSASLNGGGMLNFNNSSPTLTDVTFSSNSATNRGGGMYNRDSNPTLTDVTFSSNTAADWGGGMLNFGSSPMLTNVTFHHNSSEYNGGGMANDWSSPALTNVAFSGNSAEYNGGGMYNWNSSPMLSDVNFSGNSAFYRGGGMYNEAGSPTLTNVLFIYNTSAYGGGMANNLDSSPSLVNVTFTNNKVHLGGGGMSNFQSSPVLTNLTFKGNKATYGGGMANYYFSSPDLTNVIFQNNFALIQGGGIYNEMSSPTLTNATIYGNKQGGIYNVFNSTPALNNSILWGNTIGIPTGPYEQIKDEPSSADLTTVAYSDIQGGWTGEGNINLNPAFVDAAGGNLHLQNDSPAIDAGDNTALPAGITTDRDGNPRVVNYTHISTARVDMGAYEAQLEQNVVFLPMVVR